MPDWWTRLSKRAKIAIVAVVIVGAPFFIAGAISGAKDSGGGGKDKAAAAPTTRTAASSPASSPKAAPSHRSASSTHPAPGPTFTYPGDRQCAITYRDRGDGSMSWTATVTVPGELITHATDDTGQIYRHDVQVSRGDVAFSAPVQLARVTDIGGNLRGEGGQSYGCSVAPAR